MFALKVAAKLVRPPEATLGATFHKRGTAKLKVLLTPAGRRLLTHNKKVKLIAGGSFAAADGQTGSASKSWSSGRDVGSIGVDLTVGFGLTLNTVTYTSKLTFTITIKNGGNFQEVGVPVKLSLLHAGSQTITLPI